jgi:hypothetical protein
MVDTAMQPTTEVCESDRDRTLLMIIRVAAFLCFAGWTWVHFYWEAPYGILLWHDSTYQLASRFGISWEEFVGTGSEAGIVQRWLARTGWLYLVCTVLTLTVGQRSWLQMLALFGGSLMLVAMSYAKYLGAQSQLPMFVEHGAQMLAPVLLVSALALGVRHRVTLSIAIAALVTTFAGHGSYALDLWPTPATFYGMTCVILHVEYETALTLLRIAGVLDLIVCVAIFIPPIRRAAALYAVVWGFLTSIARPVAGMSWGLYYWGGDQFLHEAVLRAPHFLIPMYLLFLWRTPISTLQPIDQEIS